MTTPDIDPRVAACDRALRYLAARGALQKLAEPCQVLGRELCIWLPHRESSLAYDLPSLLRSGGQHQPTPAP